MTRNQVRALLVQKQKEARNRNEQGREMLHMRNQIVIC
jgi:hypothetical protein